MIGGNSRNSGKTSLSCSIIKKIAAGHEVVGLKVTSIRPGEDGFHGSHTEEVSSRFTIFEECDTNSSKDTSKMLRAGATRVYYIRVADVFVKEAILHFLSKYIKNEILVCESRSLRNIIKPGLFIMMLRIPETGRNKSIGDYLDKADLIFNFNSQQDEIQKFNENLLFIDGHFSYENTIGI